MTKIVEDYNQAHDSVVKRFLHYPLAAKDFFQCYLPKDVKKHIDFNHLELMTETFVNPDLRKHLLDVLYQTKFKGKIGYLYLLVEHASKPKRTLPFQVAKYILQALTRHLAKIKAGQVTSYNKDKPLPFIYGLIFYNGEQTPYPYSLDLRDLVDAPQDLVEDYFFKPCQLIDVSQVKDAQIKQHHYAAILSMVLKPSFARDYLQIIQEHSEILRIISDAEDGALITTLLNYILNKVDTENTDELVQFVTETVSEETGEIAMTLAQRLHQQGLEQGLEQGLDIGLKAERKRMILALSKNGLSSAKITNLLQIPTSEIEAILKSKNQTV